MLSSLSTDVRQYLLITANYWAFTLTDGALRMLVVLFFHELGYSPLQIAMLFVFYEFFGVVTNLLGGWLGARIGLNRTMNIGLLLQLLALGMLAIPSTSLTVIWVMAAQALSGIAKDLNKMSAKSAIKLLLPEGAQHSLYRWVAILTGSKNTLKGVGFFIGGGLLITFDFQTAILILCTGLALVWVVSLVFLKQDLGRSKKKPKLKSLFAKSSQINRLALARLFLFASRDVWFVVALPVYFSSQFGWSHWLTGSFMACWVIGYGVVQTQAPKITRRKDGLSAFVWVTALASLTALIALSMSAAVGLIAGLLIFGAVFAINSSLHSYLIVQYADRDSVSMDVGFYYMANASGRLLGTILSGVIYQFYGLPACLWVSVCFLTIAALVSFNLPRDSKHA